MHSASTLLSFFKWYSASTLVLRDHCIHLKEFAIQLFRVISIPYCRCGFAQSQQAYDKAVNDLFNTLDMLDAHLSSSRYLCGDVLTLADVCLFTTMIRFDLAYNVLFKCTKKKLQEYPHLHAYTREIYQVNVRSTPWLFMYNGSCIYLLFTATNQSINHVVMKQIYIFSLITN